MAKITESTSSPNLQKIEIMECGAAIGRSQMETFVKSFQQSARRWEVVVYPAMFAFIVLASYGFFLIYSLTSDMARIARSMDPNMGEHMQSMAIHMVKLSEQILVMSDTLNNISVKLDVMSPMLTHMHNMDLAMSNMDQAIEPMNPSIANMNLSIASMTQSIMRLDQSIQQMNQSTTNMDESITTMNKSIRIIAATTDQMRVDLSLMNRSMGTVSRPMSHMNSFMPW